MGGRFTGRDEVSRAVVVGRSVGFHSCSAQEIYHVGYAHVPFPTCYYRALVLLA